MESVLVTLQGLFKWLFKWKGNKAINAVKTQLNVAVTSIKHTHFPFPLYMRITFVLKPFK